MLVYLKLRHLNKSSKIRTRKAAGIASQYIILNFVDSRGIYDILSCFAIVVNLYMHVRSSLRTCSITLKYVDDEEVIGICNIYKYMHIIYFRP